MKKKVIMIVAVITAIACLTGVIVSASADGADEYIQPEVMRIPIESEKVYYAYYNSGSAKGAVALALKNEFTAYGSSEENLKICTKDESGAYSIIHEIPQTKVGTWFYGKKEFSLSTPEEIKSLLGGLSGLGVTVESDRVNFAFELNNQPIEPEKIYYVYIPEDYFVNSKGEGNMGAYIEIPAEKVNSYTGDLLTDLKKATEGIYDLALFGIESVFGLLSK